MSTENYNNDFTMTLDLNLINALVPLIPTKDIRYYLNGLHFKSNYVELTNGHYAVRIKHNMDLGQNYKPFIIPVDKLKNYLKQFTPGQRKSEMVKIDLTSPLNEHYTFTCMGNSSTFQAMDQVFPSIDRIIPAPERETETSKFAVNPEYIGDISKAMKLLSKMPSKELLPVTIVYNGPDKALTLDYNNDNYGAWVMSVRV